MQCKKLLATFLSVSMIASPLTYALPLTASAKEIQAADNLSNTVEDYTDPWNSTDLPDLEAPADENVDDAKFTYQEYTGLTVDGIANEDVFGVNREEASVFSTSGIVYDSVESAISGAKDYNLEGSKYFQMLTGEGQANWELTVVKNEADAKSDAYKDFYKADYEIFAESQAANKSHNYGIWKSGLQLPASWEYYGFDYSIYTNMGVPWQSEDNRSSDSCPAAPVNFNPVGLYRKIFTVDEGLKESGGRIYLNLQGAESAYYVYVNGKQVGYSEDSYDPHSFDVTDYLKDGENLLAIEVHRFCDGTWFELQDMYKDGGIFRDIYLYSAPLVHIDDYFITTDLDENYENATMNLDVSVRNSANTAAEGYKVDVRLYDEDGSMFFNGMTIEIPDIAAAEAKTGNERIIAHTNVGEASGSATVYAPKLWSAEKPNLYYLVLSLYSADGVYMGSMAQQHGFREIEFTRTEVNESGNAITPTEDYKQITINGERLLLKGANRHETDPVYGKHVRHEVMEKDVEIMKQNNINAVSTAHYTNDAYFYYLCNKYGLYINAEPDLECHQIQSGYEGKKAQCKELIMDRAVSALEQLKNCTSIVIWEFQNECYWSASKDYAEGAFYDVLWYFKNEDGTRPVIDAGNTDSSTLGMGNGDDVSNHGYTEMSVMESLSRWSRPWLLTEYAHSMGNATGNLMEYWENIRANDLALGGFIWDLIDQGRAITIPSGTYDYYAEDFAKETLYENDGKFYAYGGDNGERYHDGNFCQNGLVLPDRTIQPEMYEVKYVYQDFWFTASEEQLKAGQVEVFNENSFTDLNEYTLKWELLEDGVSIANGVVEDASAAPGETKVLEIPYLASLPEELKAGGEYYLNLSVCSVNATDMVPADFELSYEQFELPADVEKVEHIPVTEGVAIDESGDIISVSGEGFRFEINKATGIMENYYYGDDLLLEEGPTPNYWRALVDNDKKYDNTWLNAAKDLTAESIVIGKNEEGVDKITVTFAFPYQPALKQTMSYLIEANGAVTISTNVDATAFSGIANRFLRIGTNLVLPSGYENVTWYGNGPVEAMWDREQFARVGIYETTVSDLFFPYMSANDTGTLTGTTWFTITSDTADSALAMAAYNPLEFGALHYTQDDLTAANHPYKLTPQDKTYLSINYRSQGTGNATCGPDVLAKYSLPTSETYAYSYTLVPYEKGADVAELTHTYRKAATVEISKQQADTLNQKIDNLNITNGNQLADVEAMIEEYNDLTSYGQSLVGQARYDKLAEALTLAEKLANGTITAGIQDKSKNNFDLDISGNPEASIVDNSFKGKASLSSDEEMAAVNNVIGGNKPFTMEAYVKPNGTGTYNMIVSKGDECAAIRFSGTSADFFICNTSNSWSNARGSLDAAQRSSYVHVVGVYDGTNIYLYLDGELAASVSNAGAVKASNYPLSLGYEPQHPTERVGTTLIRNFRLYSKALTAEEVAAKAYTPSDECVEVWYDFDGGSVYMEDHKVIEASGIRTAVEEIQLRVGESYQVKAETIPYYAGNLVYSVDKENVATVDANGIVTAVGVGNAVLTISVLNTEVSVEIPITNTLPDGAVDALIQQIDAIEGHDAELDALNQLMAVYEALTEAEKQQVGTYRYDRLCEAIALKTKMTDGTIVYASDVVYDKSTNKYDLIMSEQPNMTVANGIMKGYGNVTVEGADAVFKEVFSGTNPFTVDVVFNPNGSGSGPNMIFSKGDVCAAMRVYGSGLNFFIYQTNGSWNMITANLSAQQLNSWLHVTGVYTGTQILLYVNGTLAASNTATAVAASDYPFGIGHCSQFHATSVDPRLSWASFESIHVFNRALSASEISANSVTSEDENVVLWYDFANAENSYVENGEKVTATDIRTTVESLDLTIGENAQIAAEAVPYYAGEVVYSVENEAIASVDADGLVTVFKAGTTVITAAVAGTEITKEIPLTVTIPEGALENLITKIDALEGHELELEELNQLLGIYEALTDEDKALVTDYRYEKLLEAIDLKQKMEEGTMVSAVQRVQDKSSNGFDMILAEQPDMTVADGAMVGYGPVKGDGADALYKEVFSGTNAFTVDVVMNPNGVPNGKPNMIFSKGDYCAAMRIQGTGLNFFIYQTDGNWKMITATLSNEQLNSWIHVTGVYTGSELRIYVNGNLAASGSAGTVVASDYPLGIGYCSQYDADSVEPRLSWASFRSMHIYNRALSAEEIASNSVTSADGNVVLWYDFADTEDVYNENGTKTEATGVRTSISEATLEVGETVQIMGDAMPYYAGEIVWSVDNEEIVSIAADGTVTANKDGMAVITATVKGTDISKDIPVVVKTPVRLEIITQPVGVTVLKGENAVVTVEAVGVGLTYKWYYKKASGSKFFESGVGEGDTYSIPMYAYRDGQQVYCVITDENGESVTTNIVAISMKKAAIEIIEQPKDVTVAKGENAVVTVKAVGEGLTYKWYYKKAGGSKFYESGVGEGNTYSIPMYVYRDGYQVYCVITNASGESVQTNTVTLTMQK